MATVMKTQPAMRKYTDYNTQDPADRPTWVDGIDNPYLHGPYTPVVSEITAVDLAVTQGEIPEDLYGAYMRNGPNPVFKPRGAYHWFDGDGMVHGVYFRDGRASYIRKWVQTQALHDEIERGKVELSGVMGPFDLKRIAGREMESRNPDYCKDTSNTTLNLHNGKLLSAWYNAGDVYALDPLTLETAGKETFTGGLDTPMNAHGKVDPRTGEFINYGYADFQPWLTYYVIGADGKLKHKTRIDLPGPRLPHDTTITPRFTILHDFPLFHDTELQKRINHRVALFHPELPSRFGVIPRYGTQEQVRWFEFEPGYVLHMVNAWEDGDWITMDGCFQPDPTIRRNPEEGPLGSMLAYLRYKGHLRRWRMNVVTGEKSEQQLDDLNVEFCLPDTELYGVKTRWSYHQLIPTDLQTLAFEGLVKYDHEKGTREVYPYPTGWFPSETSFAKSTKGGDEDSGYAITLATNAADWRSEAWVFDAKRITAGPIARIALPGRVAAGFHASWFTGEQLWGPRPAAI
jgi:carotenoid cleavage dioxygenase-like enzyme